MSVSIACRSAGEGGAIFASILIDLDQRLVNQTDGLPPIHRSRLSLSIAFALVEGSSTCVAARHQPRCAFCQRCPVAAPGGGLRTAARVTG